LDEIEKHEAGFLLHWSGVVPSEQQKTACSSETIEGGFFRLQFSTPWGERVICQISPPKPDTPIDPGPYHRLEQRCAYYRCNRLDPIRERGNKIYCSEECQEAAKKYRAKLKRAGVQPDDDPTG